MDQCYQGRINRETLFSLEESDQKVETKAKNALYAALAFLVLIAVATFVMLGCIYFRLTWCLLAYLAVVFPLAFAMFTLFMVKSVTSTFNLAADWPMVAFVTWNIVATGE